MNPMSDQIKCLNHLSWIFQAIREQNKRTFQETKLRMNDKAFALNKNFQQYFYSFTMYLRIFDKTMKGFTLLVSNPPLKRLPFIPLRNTYLVRAAIHFKEAGNHLKAARTELSVPGQLFGTLYQDMKAISSLLATLERDLDYLIHAL